jgi:hypothetical protein
MALAEESHIAFHPLAIRQEDGQWIVGRIDTGEFAALPDIGVEIVRALMDGLSLAEASDRLAAAHGIDVDVSTFAGELLQLGFVAEIDGIPVNGRSGPRVHLPRLEARHVGWIFSRPVKAAYAVLVAAAGAAVALRPELVPRPEDFFWTSSTSLVLAGNVLFSIFTVSVHELFHLVAARSLGVPARISLSTRLHYLVAHTDVSGLWAVPRRQRFRVYLAGMAWDIGLMAVSLLLLLSGRLPESLVGPLSTGILILFFGLVAQGHVYMRTDLYFVLLDLLRCRNLFWDAWAYTRHQLARAARLLARRRASIPPSDPLARLPPHERPKVKLYAWLQFIGSLTALGVFASYGIPIMIRMFISGWDGMRSGIAAGDAWPIVDGAVTLTVLGSLQVLFLVAWLGPRRVALGALVRRGRARLKRS